MSWIQLNDVLMLIRNAGRATDSGRVNNGVNLLEHVEDELAYLPEAGEPIDQRRRPLPYGPQSIHTHTRYTRYSGPRRRRTDSARGNHSRSSAPRVIF